MRRTWAWLAATVVTAAGLSGCGLGDDRGIDDMLHYVPEGALGAVFIDWHAITEAADGSIDAADDLPALALDSDAAQHVADDRDAWGWNVEDMAWELQVQYHVGRWATVVKLDEDAPVNAVSAALKERGYTAGKGNHGTLWTAGGDPVPGNWRSVLVIKDDKLLVLDADAKATEAILDGDPWIDADNLEEVRSALAGATTAQVMRGERACASPIDRFGRRLAQMQRAQLTAAMGDLSQLHALEASVISVRGLGDRARVRAALVFGSSSAAEADRERRTEYATDGAAADGTAYRELFTVERTALKDSVLRFGLEVEDLDRLRSLIARRDTPWAWCPVE